jgi:hypothetical protein
MKLKKAMRGVMRYIEKYIYPKLSEMQQTGYVLFSESLSDGEWVTNLIKNNIVLRAIISVDKDGDVDVDRLENLLNVSVKRKGTLNVSIPLYGDFSFSEGDISEVFKMIREEQ